MLVENPDDRIEAKELKLQLIEIKTTSGNNVSDLGDERASSSSHSVVNSFDPALPELQNSKRTTVIVYFRITFICTV